MLLSHHKLKEKEAKLVGMSREEYTKYMAENYPNMFVGLNKSMQETCMCWGFDIGCGWYHVLDSLCSKLKEIELQTGIVCEFMQVKEKFGGARFYYQPRSENCTLERDRMQVWTSIISNLVSLHEDYCDHVDDVLGTNCNPEDKIVIGSWYYGCTKDGMKKRIENQNEKGSLYNMSMERLESALTIKELRERIKDNDERENI